jgi:hypothetical protein
LALASFNFPITATLFHGTNGFAAAMAGLFVIAAAVCSLLDIAERRNCDLFQWTGVASLCCYESFFVGSVVQIYL